jgi:isoleucyl-tRNA synthetase
MSDGIFEKVLSHFDTLSADMEIVREMVSLGLDARVSAGIKVRQPLRKITFVGDRFKNISKSEELKEILLDELNIKEIEILPGEKEEVKLDIELDDELIEEGNYREFLRLVQSMRKKAGLQVEDEAELKIDIDESQRSFIDNNLEDLKKVAGIKNINYSSIEGEEDIQKINKIELKIVLIK